MTDPLNILIANEVKNSHIQSFILDDCIQQSTDAAFTITPKNQKEIIFIYDMKFEPLNGYYTGNIDVTVFSASSSKSFNYQMMDNSRINTIFKAAKSTIDLKVTATGTINSVIRYLRLIPVHFKNEKQK